MGTLHIYTFLLIASCYLSLPLTSSAEQTLASEEKVKLTTTEVKNALEILPYFLKNSADKKKYTLEISPEELNKLAVKHGFKNYQEFLKSASVIMMAYAYLQLKSNEALLLNQISKLKPEIAASFQAQMRSLAKSIKIYEKKLSPVTVKAVIPYMPKIGKILKSTK